MANKIDSDNDSGGPPVSPVGETSVSGNHEFISDCLMELKKFSTLGRIKPGNYLVTQSPTWGLVCRIDFRTEEVRLPGRINRLICWTNKKGQNAIKIAIGQAAAPLQSPM